MPRAIHGTVTKTKLPDDISLAKLSEPATGGVTEWQALQFSEKVIHEWASPPSHSKHAVQGYAFTETVGYSNTLPRSAADRIADAVELIKFAKNPLEIQLRVEGQGLNARLVIEMMIFDVCDGSRDKLTSIVMCSSMPPRVNALKWVMAQVMAVTCHEVAEVMQDATGMPFVDPHSHRDFDRISDSIYDVLADSTAPMASLIDPDSPTYAKYERKPR